LEEDEKMFKAMCISIARKEHKRISEIEEEWTLSDIAYMCASYREEALEMEKLDREFKRETQSRR